MSAPPVVEENNKLKDEVKRLKAGNLKDYAETNFILGALYSIGNKAAVEGAVETNETVGLLSELIEALFTQKAGVSFLCDELRIIERYLILQKQKMDDLEYEINVPEEIKLYRIPAMLIYPLVEYCVYCGLLYKEGNRKLTVNVKEDGESLVIEVSDNGLGISYEEVKALYPGIADEYTVINRGRNMYDMFRERLHLLFGEDSDLELNMYRKRGNRLTLSIPISFAKGDE